jgi:hypothetical protein
MWQMSDSFPEIAKSLDWKPRWEFGKTLSNDIWKLFDYIRAVENGTIWVTSRTSKYHHNDHLKSQPFRIKKAALRKLLSIDLRVVQQYFTIYRHVKKTPGESGYNEQETTFVFSDEGILIYNAFKKSIDMQFKIIQKGIFI